MAGAVLVDDVPVTKAGQTVASDATVRLRGEDHPYVSRGGLKLAAALDQFNIPVDGRTALDVGASTGGFTHVLLLRGVKKVFAVDVGKGQLDWKIRSDARVVALDEKNARFFESSWIGHTPIDLVVMDVSFISQTKIIPALLPALGPAADLVTLIKPQFELAPEKIGKGGIVRSEVDHQAAVLAVTQTLGTLGLSRKGLISSPITGTQGNIEFLAHWKMQS